MRSPAQSLVGIWQKFNQRELLSKSNSAIAKIASPNAIQEFTIVMVKETYVGEEGRW